jgi:hypothetical protein
MPNRQSSTKAVSASQARRTARVALRTIERTMQDPRLRKNLQELLEDDKCFCPRLRMWKWAVKKWYPRWNIRDAG